jgi:hypothetical protein
MRIYFFVIICLFVCNLQAQNLKYEHEKSISAIKVPGNALKTVEKITNSSNKGKWFIENSIDKISYEYKATLNHQKISIEFDSLGNFEDLELNYPIEKLTPEAIKNIKSSLDSKYSNYKIKKLQLQWDDVEKAVLYANSVNYSNIEIIVKARKARAFGIFELLFDKDAKFMSESEIVDKINSDHLDY